MRRVIAMSAKIFANKWQTLLLFSFQEKIVKIFTIKNYTYILVNNKILRCSISFVHIRGLYQYIKHLFVCSTVGHIFDNNVLLLCTQICNVGFFQ